MMLMMGGSCLVPAVSLFASADFHPSIAVPAPALDLSDLDLRDQNNRAIMDLRARHEMENLFTKNLNHLLINNLTPSLRALLFIVGQSWKISFGWMGSHVEGLVNIITSWCQDKKIWRPDFILQRGLAGLFLMSLLFLRFDVRRSFQFLVSFVLSSTQLLR